MNYIHLKSYHTKTAPFKHPLLNDCETFTEDELNEMAEKVLNGGRSDQLIMSLRFCLRNLICRYLANFQVKAYLDDMVSEGLMAITALCNNIPEDTFNESGILKMAGSRAQHHIEDMLNELRGVSSASRWVQTKCIKEGGDPIYLTAETSEYNEDQQIEDEGDIWKRDILDQLSRVELSDDIDAYLVDPFNWGRSDTELAEELGIQRTTVLRRRRSLYNRFLELLEEEE